MARAAQGEGSVYQRKTDGRWCATVFLGLRGDGKRARKAFYGASQREVVAKRKEFLRQLEAGDVERETKKKRGYTVGEWLDYWLANVIEPDREPTTFDGYRKTVDNHIKPHLGHIPLRELETEHIEKWLKMMRERKPPVGLRTRQQALARLRTALGEALARRQQAGVRFNAAAVARMPRGPKRSVPPPSVEDARALLDAARGERLEAMVVVALGLGLRRGEILGLRWEDIDWEGRVVTIRRRISRVTGKSLLVRSGTKMNPDSAQTIVLPNLVADALKAHRGRQALERLPTGYVFTNTTGGPIEPRTITRFFGQVRERAGLRSKTMHHLRHDCASLLLAGGVPMWVVSQILRHRSPEITARIYAHVTSSGARDAADRMDDVLRQLGG